jgi:cysteinyl-tRNA synthetase
MRWPSPWSDGFPGWHLECSAMSMKYLGDEFDIHGGGMDLLFPHHECEIAQSKAANGVEAVKTWMHNNMITINGQKMGKSLGNFITLEEFFTGSHDLLDQAYSPMTVRFFILQAHYRSTVDFSNEALLAAQKGMERLFKGIETLEKIPTSDTTSFDIDEFKKKCYDALLDDLNSPILISYLFDGIKFINNVANGKDQITEQVKSELVELYHTFAHEILGLEKEASGNSEQNEAFSSIVELLLNLRLDAKANKDFETADKIRNQLTEMGFTIKDKKDGFDWEYNA